MLQSTLFALAFWLLLLPALWISGSLAAFKLNEKNPLLVGVLRLAFGFLVLSQVLVLAGTLDALNFSVVLVFLAFFWALGWQKAREVYTWLADLFKFFRSEPSLFGHICQYTFLATLALTFLFCFLPETSNDGIGVHLFLAKLFVTNGSLDPSYFDIISYRPLLMSLLYAVGILLNNAAIAKLLHWFCGVLLIGATAIKIQQAAENKRIALFLSLMLWLTPTLMNQVTTTYIDAGVSLFIFLGYCIFLEALKDLKPVEFFYSGLLIGVAVAMRYLSLSAYCTVMTLLAFRFFQKGVKIRVLSVAIWFTLGVSLTSAYWFLRAWLHTGNPVYPYLSQLFGTQDFTFLDVLYFEYLGLPKSLGNFLMLLWNMTFKPQYFDYYHWIGPFYLSALPFFLYAAVVVKSARIHVFYFFFFTIFWYFTGQDTRYFLPVIPVYLIATAIGMKALSEVFGTGKRLILAKTAAITLIASLFLVTIRHFRFQFMPLLGVWSVRKYMRQVERSIPIAEWMNEHLPQDAKILNLDEPHQFYFERASIMDMDFNARTDYKSHPSPDAIASHLKERGITHILDFTEICNSKLVERGPRPIDRILKDGRFSRLLVSIPSENIVDRKYQYTLYQFAEQL